MNKLIREFLNYLKVDKNFSPDTIKSYQYDLEKFFSYINSEGIPFNNINETIIRNFVSNELINGISKRSCERRICTLNDFCSYWSNEQKASRKEINYNPLKYMSRLKIDKKLPSILYKEQIEKILSANKDRTDQLMYRDQVILELLYYSGVRASELVNMKIQNIDLRNRKILVFGKGSKERMVLISENCANTLNYYVKNIRPVLFKKTKQPSPNLILNNQGNPLTTRGLEYILKQVEIKTGQYFGLHPHIFRHSLATHLLDNGADIRDIKEILGHESINTTQIYAHVSEEAMKETYKNSFPRAKKK